jgi:hypothetical protein
MILFLPAAKLVVGATRFSVPLVSLMSDAEKTSPSTYEVLAGNPTAMIVSP